MKKTMALFALAALTLGSSAWPARAQNVGTSTGGDLPESFADSPCSTTPA